MTVQKRVVGADVEPSATSGLKVYDAREIVNETGVAQIVLDHQVYTLRITRLGKLILTK